jgi:putative ABC transport system permease protein
MSDRAPALRLYRGLLWLYPAEFREYFETEMCRTLSDLLRDRPGLAEILGLYCGVLIDAPKEHYHMLHQDITYALRAMAREKMTSLISIFVLALGIGSVATVFTLFNGMMLRPLPYPDQQRLAYVEEFKAGELRAAVAYPNFLDFQTRNRSLESIAMFGSGLATLRGDMEAERVQASNATGSLFRVLGVPPLLGRTFNDADDAPKAPPVVVLGEALWKRRYGGDPEIIGKTIVLGSTPAQVIGIMPREFRFPGQAELWSPLQATPQNNKRTDHGLEGIARMRPGVTTEQAQTDLRAIMDQITREHPTETYRQTVNVFPYRARNTQEIRPVLFTLLGAVACVLLIACANIVNLLLVKASGRAREIAVRSALGASRARLIRQFVVETALLSWTGATGGVLLAWAAAPALLSLAPVGYFPAWMRFTPDARVLGFVIAVTVCTTLVVGVAPAISASRSNIVETLKEGGRANTAGGKRSWFRASLVVAEVALSVLLLAGAGLMVRTFVNLMSQRLGFGAENVVTFQTAAPSARYPNGPTAQELVRSIVREARAIPGVIAAAGSSSIPLTGSWGRSFTAEGAPLLSLKDAPLINHIVVTPGYFHTLGIPVLEGRDFDEHDAKDPLVTIVDAGIARRYWPHESAIGKRVRYGPPEDNEPWHTVVGVVGLVRNQSPRELRRNSVYLPQGEFGFNSLGYLVRTAPRAPDPVPALRARLAALDKSVAISNVLTIKDVIRSAVWQERFFTMVLAAFALLALVLALVGLFGVLSYTVSQRTHEMGIRMALGASPGEIRRMILGQSGRLVIAGLLVGAVGAALLTRLLGAQLYEVRANDPATLGIVAVLLVATAMVASYFPARKATRVDPMNALRVE